MKISIKGTPAEIAALVVAIQERQIDPLHTEGADLGTTVVRLCDDPVIVAKSDAGARWRVKDYIQIPRTLRIVAEEAFLD